MFALPGICMRLGQQWRNSHWTRVDKVQGAPECWRAPEFEKYFMNLSKKPGTFSSVWWLSDPKMYVQTLSRVKIGALTEIFSQYHDSKLFHVLTVYRVDYDIHPIRYLQQGMRLMDHDLWGPHSIFCTLSRGPRVPSYATAMSGGNPRMKWCEDSLLGWKWLTPGNCY